MAHFIIRFKLILKHYPKNNKIEFYCEDLSNQVEYWNGIENRHRFIYYFNYEENQLYKFVLPCYYIECDISHLLNKMPKYILGELKLQLGFLKPNLKIEHKSNLENLIKKIIY